MAHRSVLFGSVLVVALTAALWFRFVDDGEDTLDLDLDLDHALYSMEQSECVTLSLEI